jgi:tRNA nucleotidyltransferase (CCA-adding enzyme)
VTPAGARAPQRARLVDSPAGKRPASGADTTAVDPEEIGRRIPDPVHAVLRRLADAGFEAYVVGGSLRDLILGRPVEDWDIATSALPEQTQALFPGSVYENRFGTVAVKRQGGLDEITTFRREHEYGDHRRPGRVEFGTTLEDDLTRRDFTINALAWGVRDGAAVLIDPFGGVADLRAGVIRTVGLPEERFGEDALRMVRAVRFAAALGFTIDPRTHGAISANAGLATDLSGERVAAELRRILASDRPSVALRLADETGLLDVLFPELALQRGMSQNKVAGEDLWDHTVASVDAADASRPAVRLAALLHDVGKPATLHDGHFPDHDREGARIADAILRRLAFPRQDADRVVHLVGQHMFTYTPSWSDAAIRRFIRRVGVEAVEDLLALREADNVGSGLPPDAGHLAELRRRVTAELHAGHALELADLAVDGDDIRSALGLEQGPEVGRILHRLLENVVADPALNERDRLLAMARRVHAGWQRPA